jgi:hypothetical protein
MKNIIAKRTLTCEGPRGEDTNVIIALTKPQKSSAANSWQCWFIIEGGNIEDKMLVHGADSLQALFLATKALQTKVALYKKRYRLRWIADVKDGLS